jgi:hypothetical protein
VTKRGSKKVRGDRRKRSTNSSHAKQLYSVKERTKAKVREKSLFVSQNRKVKFFLNSSSLIERLAHVPATEKKKEQKGFFLRRK